MEKNNNKNNNNNKNSSNSLVFGRWPQTKIKRVLTIFHRGMINPSIVGTT